MSRPVSIAVVMACHNRQRATIACLQSLAAQDSTAALHLIVYDDGSQDGTAEAVRAVWRDATVLKGSGWAFWAGGMRAAFAAAVARGFDYYLWLNDDVVLAPDAISRLLATCKAVEGAGHPLMMIGGGVSEPQAKRPTYGGVNRSRGVNPLRFHFRPPLSDAPLQCDTLNGNIVLIPHATAVAVGPIDEGFVHTLADLDYGLRVGQAGGWVGLVSGFLGTCRTNAGGMRWFNPSLSLVARWSIVNRPLGFPLRPWLRFARRHGGPFWPLFVAWPYWRLFVPPAVTALLSRRRARLSGRHEAAHVA